MVFELVCRESDGKPRSNPPFLSPNSDKIQTKKKNAFEINGLSCRLIATPVFGERQTLGAVVGLEQPRRQAVFLHQAVKLGAVAVGQLGGIGHIAVGQLEQAH